MFNDIWNGCYDYSWSGVIVPEAFSHPAKFSRGLIYQIYRHAKEEGWLKEGDTVLDCFAGVGLGALDCLFLGLNWIGVELEPKFCKLAEENFEFWRRKFIDFPNGQIRIIQGDSRRLKEGDISAIISSPPYEEGIGHGGKMTQIDKKKGLYIANSERYSEDKTNLGNTSGNTFWSASHIILKQCFDLLKPGGHAIWVTKAYCKKGAIVDFPGRWKTLCESVGFKSVCEHRAMLVKKYGTQIKTNGENENIEVARKSFFRRLHETKRPDLKIDWEMVQCMVKS